LFVVFHAVAFGEKQEAKSVAVHRASHFLVRAGDDAGAGGVRHQIAFDLADVVGVGAAAGRVAVGKKRHPAQGGHGKGVGAGVFAAVTAGPAAVVSLGFREIVEATFDGDLHGRR